MAAWVSATWSCWADSVPALSNNVPTMVTIRRIGTPSPRLKTRWTISALDAEFFVAAQTNTVEGRIFRLQTVGTLELGLRLADCLHKGRDVRLEIRPLRPYLGRGVIFATRFQSLDALGEQRRKAFCNILRVGKSLAHGSLAVGLLALGHIRRRDRAREIGLHGGRGLDGRVLALLPSHCANAEQQHSRHNDRSKHHRPFSISQAF